MRGTELRRRMKKKLVARQNRKAKKAGEK